MGLSNGASRARNYGQTINQSQGGGNKKAGFPYIVGRSSWSTIFLGGNNVENCAGLPCYQFTRNPNVRLSRPMGSTIQVPYWSLP